MRNNIIRVENKQTNKQTYKQRTNKQTNKAFTNGPDQPRENCDVAVVIGIFMLLDTERPLLLLSLAQCHCYLPDVLIDGLIYTTDK